MNWTVWNRDSRSENVCQKEHFWPFFVILEHVFNKNGIVTIADCNFALHPQWHTSNGYFQLQNQIGIENGNLVLSKDLCGKWSWFCWKLCQNGPFGHNWTWSWRVGLNCICTVIETIWVINLAMWNEWLDVKPELQKRKCVSRRGFWTNFGHFGVHFRLKWRQNHLQFQLCIATRMVCVKWSFSVAESTASRKGLFSFSKDLCGKRVNFIQNYDQVRSVLQYSNVMVKHWFEFSLHRNRDNVYR